jgi:hypothetical protein
MINFETLGIQVNPHDDLMFLSRPMQHLDFNVPPGAGRIQCIYSAYTASTWKYCKLHDMMMMMIIIIIHEITPSIHPCSRRTLQ